MSFRTNVRNLRPFIVELRFKISPFTRNDMKKSNRLNYYDFFIFKFNIKSMDNHTPCSFLNRPDASFL